MNRHPGPIAGNLIMAKPTGRQKRGRDIYSQHRDDGCGLAPSCLECPLEECQYDSPEYRAASARQERAQGKDKGWGKL